MVCVPLFYDQYSNAKRAEQKRIAITIPKLQFDFETLSRAMDQVLNNGRLKFHASIFVLIQLIFIDYFPVIPMRLKDCQE